MCSTTSTPPCACTPSAGLQSEPTIEIDCDLAGFLYKTIEFEGSASHAGLDPFSGTNAYAMATLFTTALGLGRQQLREDVLVRMNPVIPASEMTTNVIPHRVHVGTDVRSIDLDYLGEVADRVDRAAHGCASALGGTAHITTEMGYLPFVQDRTLSGAFRESFTEDDAITHLIEDRGAIAAAGDAGDLSFMMPTVQLSYGGFDGVIHGKDFRMVDPEHVLISVPPPAHPGSAQHGAPSAGAAAPPQLRRVRARPLRGRAAAARRPSRFRRHHRNRCRRRHRHFRRHHRHFQRRRLEHR